MTRRSKKHLIAGLMLTCCIVSAVLLFTSHSRATKNFDDLTKVDSLLNLTFQKFHIKKERIRVDSTNVDSIFSRKIYTITVKPGFHQTRFHTSLQQIFFPYHIKLPANVVFPEKDLHIQFIYDRTVIATVELKTKEQQDEKKQG